MSKPKVDMKDHFAVPSALRFLSPRVDWLIPDPDVGLLSWTKDAGAHWHRIQLPRTCMTVYSGRTDDCSELNRPVTIR